MGGGASSDQSGKARGSPAPLGPGTPSAAPSSRKEAVRQVGAESYIPSHSSAPFPPFPLIPTRLVRDLHRFPQILQECPPGASPGPSCRCIIRSPHPASAACPSSAFSRGLSTFRLRRNDGNGSFLPDEGSDCSGEWGPERPSQGAWFCQCAGTLCIHKSLT